LELDLNQYEILKKLPRVKNSAEVLLIYDSILAPLPVVKKWLSQFPFNYAVKSGETLKKVEGLPSHLEKILNIQQKGQITFSKIYVMGGGSVGDFGGFVASILKRGIPVVQIPSTWLAALDSAHGGKTALNVGGFKNQVGTFHYPEKIFIVQELLETQPAIRLREAAGEFLKTAFLGGTSLMAKLSKWDWVKGKINWEDLKSFIDVKYSVLKKDPFEKNGFRHVLNLGHTMGHAWEASQGLPHGKAIYYGLLFDMAWSTQLGYFPSKAAQKLMKQQPWSILFDVKSDKKLFKIKEEKLENYLLQDKKNSSKGLRYVFIEKPGRVAIKIVQIKDVIKEFRRQKKILEDFYEDV
jgi:3-dehydroquinate synthase